jgi:hypothetical protein
MVTERAKVAIIEYGFGEFEGLMFPSSGEYRIAISQLARLFSVRQDNIQREVKALMGEDFQFVKCLSELNNRKVNTLSIEEAARFAQLLAFKGNALAQSFCLASVSETLERRFDRAFEKVVDEEEYNHRLALRMKRVLARKDWTDVLMERHVDLYKVKPCPNDYRAWTTEVNWHLFDRPHFNSDRDTMSLAQQETIFDFERMAKRLAKKHPTYSPSKLIQLALETF